MAIESVPRCLRYFLHRDAALQGAALRVFLRVLDQCLRTHSPSAGPAARLGAVAFIRRFGSTLNPQLHLHGGVIDGVLDSAAAGRVIFHAAAGRERLLRHVLAPSVGRGKRRTASPAGGAQAKNR